MQQKKSKLAVGKDRGTEITPESEDEKTKTEKDIGENDLFGNLQDNEMLKELITPENYEKVEGKKNVYRQKEGVEFEGFQNVTITIEKGTCTIQMILYTDNGMALDTVVVISNIGKMDVALPRVG